MTEADRAALVERVANLVRLAMQHPWAGAENAAKGILAAIEPAIRADDRAKAEAERDEARALLRGVRDWLVDEKLNTWPYMEGPGFYDDKETWVHCLNTSL